jgi:hypothetical protein
MCHFLSGFIELELPVDGVVPATTAMLKVRGYWSGLTKTAHPMDGGREASFAEISELCAGRTLTIGMPLRLGDGARLAKSRPFWHRCPSYRILPQ